MPYIRIVAKDYFYDSSIRVIYNLGKMEQHDLIELLGLSIPALVSPEGNYSRALT